MHRRMKTYQNGEQIEQTRSEHVAGTATNEIWKVTFRADLEKSLRQENEREEEVTGTGRDRIKDGKIVAQARQGDGHKPEPDNRCQDDFPAGQNKRYNQKRANYQPRRLCRGGSDVSHRIVTQKFRDARVHATDRFAAKRPRFDRGRELYYRACRCEKNQNSLVALFPKSDGANP